MAKHQQILSSFLLYLDFYSPILAEKGDTGDQMDETLPPRSSPNDCGLKCELLACVNVPISSATLLLGPNSSSAGKAT